MTSIFATAAMTPDGWIVDARIDVHEGRIVAVESGTRPQAGDVRVGIVIPGLPNLHSHAFQRGMAGRAEIRGESTDTFWTWRETMYRFALAMSPDQMEAVAAMAYLEMLETGFTRVGEFHYLHHDPDGRPYADLAEMSGRIANAALATGIRLTLLPSFYAHGDFGGAFPVSGQRRFLNDIDRFSRIMERCREIIAPLPGAVLGVAPHSLRAVTPEELAAVVTLAGNGPVHIHAAEQLREVDACVGWSGQRPVAWLLGHADVGGRWCLIHATHLDQSETRELAASGAVAGLCPITEANLGDGIFPGRLYSSAGGAYGIGTDSNVQIDAAAELRQLEYAQRLGNLQRNVLADGPGATGDALIRNALTGGARALGSPAPGIAAGAAADLVSLSIEEIPDPLGPTVVNGWIFSGTSKVDRVWVAGELVVEGGRHLRRESIQARYRQVLASILGA